MNVEIMKAKPCCRESLETAALEDETQAKKESTYKSCHIASTFTSVKIQLMWSLRLGLDTGYAGHPWQFQHQPPKVQAMVVFVAVQYSGSRRHECSSYWEWLTRSKQLRMIPVTSGRVIGITYKNRVRTKQVRTSFRASMYSTHCLSTNVVII